MLSMATRKEPIKIYGNDSLSERMSLFQKAQEHKPKIKKTQDHLKLKKSNQPLSVGGKSNCPILDKNDPRYGRPVEGSKTEKRGIQAGNHVSNEVRLLCDIISEYGEFNPEDGTTVILFGELFEIYTRISNKVVGILIRARRHGFVEFEGEILFQRKDDHVEITLLKPIEELKKVFAMQEEPAWAIQKGIEK